MGERSLGLCTYQELLLHSQGEASFIHWFWPRRFGSSTFGLSLLPALKMPAEQPLGTAPSLGITWISALHPRTLSTASVGFWQHPGRERIWATAMAPARLYPKVFDERANGEIAQKSATPRSRNAVWSCASCRCKRRRRPSAASFFSGQRNAPETAEDLAFSGLFLGWTISGCRRSDTLQTHVLKFRNIIKSRHSVLFLI